MEARAVGRKIRISPQKARLVADVIALSALIPRITSATSLAF